MTPAPVPDSTTDVIILGAGVAGLAAAGRLVAAGLAVTIVEARERLGGRVYTRRSGHAPWPAELGAEFVHGRPPTLLSIAREAGLTLVRGDGDEWEADETCWRRLRDFGEIIAPVMAALPDDDMPDLSFAAVLAGGDVSAQSRRARALALAYVEGFNASDACAVSARWLRKQEDGGGDAENFRIVEGYGRVVDWLSEQVAGARLLTGHIATAVRWSAGGARVAVRSADGEAILAARRVLWTLPVGVWTADPGVAGAVAFDPPLPDAKREALALTASGHAARIVLRFCEPFWRTGAARRRAGDDLGALAFLHTTDERYNVFWTSYPVESPVLTAWAGGPRAAAMAGLPHETRLGHALDALAAVTGETRATIAALLERADEHDWSADPFARGAYAYPRVGGALAARTLAAPVGDTLFFAGEATHTGTACGTVHGAIETGYRAADELLAATQG